ncbi:MAG: NAD+ synthase [Porticoccaceae bacterium]
MAQFNPLVGDIPGNADKILAAVRAARDEQGAQILVFPELALIGYPPEDLLLRPALQARIERALDRVRAESRGIVVVLGYPWREGDRLYNAAGVLRDGELIARYHKRCLPNYQVFDEQRYFVAGDAPCVVDLYGVPTAITICEDVWRPEPTAAAAAAGARLMLNLNASPFHRGKQERRQQVLAARAREGHLPILYVNQVGGQDELVFDGGSILVDAGGAVCFQAPQFEEGMYAVVVEAAAGAVTVPRQQIVPALEPLASVYRALVLGVRDYVRKNGFKGVVLGLSGGIDSALTLAIAVDALGAEQVEAVMLPYRYTSDLSRDLARDQAERLGVRYRTLDIAPVVDAAMEVLAEEFAGLGVDKTEENLQARARGLLLMAISNKKGSLVLTTGNKSEMAVGYATLYGDMAGGLDVLKDVPKVTVFELARYRNRITRNGIAPVIPEAVITRPPSAELAPGQKDEDSLPPYPVLDRILELYVEQDASAADIIAQGFPADEVHRVLRMVDLNEYKRRQAPVGLRVSERAFGRDRRYPITNGWRPGD